MPLNITDFVFVVFFVVLVCVKCDNLNNKINSSLAEANHEKLSEVGSDLGLAPKPNVKTFDRSKNIESSASLDSTKQTNPVIGNNQFNVSTLLQKTPTSETHRNLDNTEVNIGLSEVPLEGGGAGVLFETSSVNKANGQVNPVIERFEDEIPNKGSKGRKGVKFPVSSVVARKGVPVGEDDFKPLNLASNTSTDPSVTAGVVINNSFIGLVNQTKSVKSGTPLINKFNLTQNFQTPSQKSVTKVEPTKTVHSKKPEYVSDEKDADYSDKYSLIHTSTTGEDYVIIGIVIVIGIWFSVFGALIFYRRAGEYWDRRHYRRMDFLVEGMYND